MILMPLPQNKSLFAFFFFFLAPLFPILRTSTPYSYCFFRISGHIEVIGTNYCRLCKSELLCEQGWGWYPVRSSANTPYSIAIVPANAALSNPHIGSLSSDRISVVARIGMKCETMDFMDKCSVWSGRLKESHQAFGLTGSDRTWPPCSCSGLSRSTCACPWKQSSTNQLIAFEVLAELSLTFGRYFCFFFFFFFLGPPGRAQTSLASGKLSSWTRFAI